MVVLYVDDAFTIGDRGAINEMFEELKHNGINITTEEHLEDYISCEVVFNKTGTKAWLGQPHMIKKIRQAFGDQVAHLKGGTKTPGTPGFQLMKPEEGEPALSPELQSEFRSGVGMLLYLVKHSRPDIANCVRELTKGMSSAPPHAYKEMLRVIKHVLDTHGLGLKIFPIIFKGKIVWHLLVYSDSDWAGDKANRKSISGFIFFFCGVPIMWRSKQQLAVSMSSSEAKWYAVSEAVKEIMFVLQVLISVGIAVETPVVVKVDNMGAIFMGKHSTTSARTRHISCRLFYVRQMQADQLISLEFVPTASNWSDGMTKNVKADVHTAHVPNYVCDKQDVGKEQ